MDIALIVLGFVVIGYLHQIASRQIAAQRSRKRALVARTLLKYVYTAGGKEREDGPILCEKLIELDYIPTIGMQIHLDGIGVPLKVVGVVDEGDGFVVVLAKHLRINWDTGNEHSIDFAAELEEQGWKVVSHPNKDHSERKDDFWDSWPK